VPMGNRANGGIPTSQDSLCSVIAITGLALEARIVRGKAIIIDPLRAPEIMLGTIPSDVAGILSFGVRGGLAPDLIPGQCIVGSSVIYGDQYFQTDKEWSNRLAALPGAKYARIAGVDSPIAEPQERKRFYDHTESCRVRYGISCCRANCVFARHAVRGVPSSFEFRIL
jgi:adenosylhomocysteine nucleosidase